MRGSGVPVIVSEQTNPWRGPAEKRWRLLRRLVYPLARAVVPLNDRCAAYFRFLPAAKVKVIPNPVLEPGVDSVPVSRNRVILAVGRLDPVKRLDLLIRAFHAVVPRLPGWSLALYGEGPQRAMLEDLIAELGLRDSVSLMGVTREPHAVMRRASIFALTSRYEGFPNALCEAMACGMAVVAMDCETGPRELIAHGENGLLVPAGDEAALADALLLLAGDPEQRAALGARAARIAEKYPPAIVLESWRNLFLEVLAGDSRVGSRRRNAGDFAP
jgi:glycosyltransferase involved in cell wall biosynthesis